MTDRILNKIVDHLFPIRQQFMWDIDGNTKDFDYPNYGGLPRSISYKLSPESVDAIQQVIDNPVVRKRDFKRLIKNRMLELGERFR